MIPDLYTAEWAEGVSCEAQVTVRGALSIAQTNVGPPAGSTHVWSGSFPRAYVSKGNAHSRSRYSLRVCPVEMVSPHLVVPSGELVRRFLWSASGKSLFFPPLPSLDSPNLPHWSGLFQDLKFVCISRAPLRSYEECQTLQNVFDGYALRRQLRCSCGCFLRCGCI